MRLFVAIYPSPEAVAHLAQRVGSLALGAARPPGQSVRLVGAERWHITLAFLGDIPDDREDAVRDAVAAAAARWPAHGTRPRIGLGGGGRFAGKSGSTVVWIGMRGDVDAVRDLAAGTRRELRSAHVPFDAKAFRPHVTLARPADRLSADDLDADLAALSRYEGPKWTVESIELVRSHLGPNIRYERLAAFPI